MKLQDAIAHFDNNASALARALNIQPESVSQWRKKGVIPAKRQYELERLTGGKLKADWPQHAAS